MAIVHTQSVYSRQAESLPAELAARVPRYADGTFWRLYQHQLETYQALVNGDAQVIFNTALTGDGKSLAGQLPLLVRGGDAGVLAMYPTNELIRDQLRQFKDHTRPQWQATVNCEHLDSAQLDRIMADSAEFYDRRGDALLEVFSNSDLVLTNPDIFHLVMQHFYLWPGDAPDRLIGPLVQRYGQFTFDEFHIFDTPQVVSVLNALLFIDETESAARPHKYLFLSATPIEIMSMYLERSGLRVKEITGNYSHGSAPASGQWREILRPTTLHFDNGKVEAWIEEHLEDTLLPFFLERRPHAKGAIIVNSVAAAHRLLARLQAPCQQVGLTVAPNTGLTSRAGRHASYEADLLIGTSTVDVGVDFQINFLLFESRDAGSFLQRLGRLGRHGSYERDGHEYAFQDYEAHALVPPWITEALFVGKENAAPPLKNGAEVDREHLNRAIEQAFPMPTTFDHYAQRWGKLQSAHVLRKMGNPTIRAQYATARENLAQRYAATFSFNPNGAILTYRDFYQEQRALWEEAIAFRGGSYFTCGILDTTENDLPKSADLLMLVANARLAPLEEEDFYAVVARVGMQRRIFERQEPLAFYKLLGWREERENYKLTLAADIAYWGAERFTQATVMKGWELDATLPERYRLNRRLRRRHLPTWLVKGMHPLELKRRFRLPLLFALYEFSSRDGIQGSVAFGREALLLDTRTYYSSLRGAQGANDPIIC